MVFGAVTVNVAAEPDLGDAALLVSDTMDHAYVNAPPFAAVLVDAFNISVAPIATLLVPVMTMVGAVTD